MKRFLILLLSGVAFWALTACSSSDSTPAEQESSQTAETAKGAVTEEEAASFAAYDTDGSLQASSQWIGKKPVVLNFWGTWCPPCRKEIPDMVKVYDEYAGSDIEMIGLAVNDTPDKVVNFARQNNMNWVLLMADEAVVQEFAPIVGVPTTIFLDHTGKEVHRHTGPITYTQLKQAFDALLQIQADAMKS